MAEFWSGYALFAAKGVTILVLLLIAVRAAARSRKAGARASGAGRLRLEPLNPQYLDFAQLLGRTGGKAERAGAGETGGRRQRRRLLERKWTGPKGRSANRAAKAAVGGSAVSGGASESTESVATRSATADTPRHRILVLDFHGDLVASAVDALRAEVSAVLAGRRENDEVLLRLDNSGGTVTGHGLAAAQLARLRTAGVPLTVSVDKVAASGGYLMAAVADHIVAAPFAVVGSIGVVSQTPNLHRLLDRAGVDVELHTAGEYKRTLTMLGENTDAGRAKHQEQLGQIHGLFKDYVSRFRPALRIDELATGEYWFGQQALDLGLIDEVLTSDEYLFAAAQRADLVRLRYELRQSPADRMRTGLSGALRAALRELGLGGPSAP